MISSAAQSDMESRWAIGRKGESDPESVSLSQLQSTRQFRRYEVTQVRLPVTGFFFFLTGLYLHIVLTYATDQRLFGIVPINRMAWLTATPIKQRVY